MFELTQVKYVQPCDICLPLEKAASKEFVNNHFDPRVCISSCTCPGQCGMDIERGQRLLDSLKGTWGILNGLENKRGYLHQKRVINVHPSVYFVPTSS